MRLVAAKINMRLRRMYLNSDTILRVILFCLEVIHDSAPV